MTKIDGEVVLNSKFNTIHKYKHEVLLNDLGDSKYEVQVLRHNDWIRGHNEVTNVTKSSFSEAREIYNYYIEKLKSTV